MTDLLHAASVLGFLALIWSYGLSWLDRTQWLHLNVRAIIIIIHRQNHIIIITNQYEQRVTVLCLKFSMFNISENFLPEFFVLFMRHNTALTKIMPFSQLIF